MAALPDGTMKAGVSSSSDSEGSNDYSSSSNENKQHKTVMTINMNVKPKGEGTAENRRKLLSEILKSNRCDIIFCQELPGMFDKFVKKLNYKYNRNENESAVMWAPGKFDVSTQSLGTNDRCIREIRDKIPNHGTDAGSELLSRIAMVKLTSKQNKTETTLAVSYHGPYREMKIQARKEAFIFLQKFLQEVIKRNNIDSYIIGGDFNFNTLKLKNCDENVAVCKYELSPRARENTSNNFIPYKDNFVYHPKAKLTVKDIEPLDISEMSNSKLLDHDPVVGELQFTHKTEESSQTKKNEAGISDNTDKERKPQQYLGKSEDKNSKTPEGTITTSREVPKVKHKSKGRKKDEVGILNSSKDVNEKKIGKKTPSQDGNEKVKREKDSTRSTWSIRTQDSTKDTKQNDYQVKSVSSTRTHSTRKDTQSKIPTEITPVSNPFADLPDENTAIASPKESNSKVAKAKTNTSDTSTKTIVGDSKTKHSKPPKSE